ncbi:MAG: alpha/beta fold hydrolase [Candidatus Hydrogenedentes bacterium]|nr:alpha/beta fold hydrolase [Candidatus Hydrogenedentota bacterium]
MGFIALKSTKWALDIATKMIKANIRVHNIEHVKDDMAIVYVVNHFTRVETVLLPYILHKYTGKEIWSLAAAELFEGKIGEYLLSMGNVSTKNPDRDTIIVNSLLTGEHPWIIFPEGGMIKDKKVVDQKGDFKVYSKGTRRPPHTGAAVLALRAEYFRQRLACFKDRPGKQEVIQPILSKLGLTDIDQAFKKRTYIVPVNITYFPIRARDNMMLRIARAFAKDLSKRAIEELSVEGTVLSADTDIDVTFGDPIEVGHFLQETDCKLLVESIETDLNTLEEDPESGFNEAARRLMVRFMADIYRNTTVNYDHIFGTLIRNQRARKFTDRAYRNRIFLAVHQIKQLGQHRLHHVLDRSYRDILYEDASPILTDFLDLCLSEGILLKQGNEYVRNTQARTVEADFHNVRKEEVTSVIANEVEPLTILTGIIQNVARLPRPMLSSKIRAIFLKEDLDLFEHDYANYATSGENKPPDVGRPFLLTPQKFKAGIVLVHGYMAAPLEVKAMADYFAQRGFAVYAVRLKGHGTSAEDLARTPWEEWYESVNRGYAIVKSLTDNIVLGGFSTGGVLALLAAGRKKDKVKAVFSINAPLQLRNYMARFASQIVSMNSLIARLKRGTGWVYIENNPENKHINYTRNPITGVRELGKAMSAMEGALKDISVPTLIVQGYRDPIVDPTSGQNIFSQIGTHQKELIVIDAARHGIINGEGSVDVYDRIDRFLMRAREHENAAIATESEAAEAG